MDLRLSIDEIHSLLQILMIVAGVATVIALLMTTAPYGRYFRAGWGPALPARIAWMTQESPSWIVPLLVAFLPDPSSFIGNPASRRTIQLGIFVLHYIHRSLIYPFRIANGKTTPLSVWSLALLFCIWNGFLQGWTIRQYIPASDEGGIITYVGYSIWLLGFIGNIRADITLTNLKSVNRTGYGIPRGGLFEYVSAANYFAEIVEWFGFALALQSPSGWVFFYYTLCNLVPRGYSHHLWYRQKFADYPTNRKAVIPFLL